MRTASKILIYFSIAILLFFVIFCIFRYGIYAQYNYWDTDYIKYLIDKGSIKTNYEGTSMEQAVEFKREVSIYTGIYMYLATSSFFLLIFSFIASYKDNKIIYILCLIVSTPLLFPLTILASIFGLIAIKREEDARLEEIHNS